MRPVSVCCVFVALMFATVCPGQEREWEVGGAAGFGYMRNPTVNRPAGSATIGFDNRLAAGAVIGQDLYQHFSGELRYTFRDGDLLLKSGGQKVNMDGDSHLVHYDVLFHALRRGSRFRPYAAAGAGIRLFRATGREYESQPFSDFAFLTKTQEVKPLISVGAGVKFTFADHAAVRFDFREYISPFPEKLFVTAPGVKIRSWLYDSAPLVGLSFVF
jgi:hypothetical protein